MRRYPQVGGVVFFGIPWKQQFKAKVPCCTNCGLNWHAFVVLFFVYLFCEYCPWIEFASSQALFDQSNLPVDVLIAHEPPKGILDSGHGCDTLREICLGTAASQKFATDTADAVMSDVFAAEECGDTPTKSGAGGPAANPDFSPTADHKHPKPRVVLFGHIHECAGVETVANTTFINCAVVRLWSLVALLTILTRLKSPNCDSKRLLELNWNVAVGERRNEGTQVAAARGRV